MSEPLPRSALAGVVWPAATAPAASAVRALQWQFERSERWPAERLQAQQFQQLAALLDHCAATVPYWRTRLAQAGLPAGGTLTPASWQRLPVLTRSAVRAAGAALHATPVPPQHGRLLQVSTSGSTGVPLVCHKTDVTRLFWHAAVVRETLWHGLDPAGRLAIIAGDPGRAAPPPDGLALAGWGPSLAAAFQTGPAARLDIQAPVPAQADWLRRQDPDCLLSWASNIAALARHCLDAGIRLPRLRAVRSVAEPVAPALRALCRAAWGATVIDAYSAEETGYIALQCPESELYHVLAEDVLLEVLDDAGAPCAPGQAGRVVVTPLHNFAMPLLRYEIGDGAVPGGRCRCGRTLPTLTRVLGRLRDRLLLPGGERRFAVNPSEAFAAIAAVQRYQIAQVAPELLEIRLVARAALTPAETATLADALADALGHRFALRLVYLDGFSRRPGQKFRDVVCELDATGAAAPQP
jgi:phenylacetate-CoA ligase